MWRNRIFKARPEGLALDSGFRRNDPQHRIKGMYFVYIMASERNGTLYVGVTNDIARRAYEHREGLIDDFSKKYNVKRLVYFEPHDDVESAIRREKQTKDWQRAWKLDLIETDNPDWIDLFDSLTL